MIYLTFVNHQQLTSGLLQLEDLWFVVRHFLIYASTMGLHLLPHD